MESGVICKWHTSCDSLTHTTHSIRTLYSQLNAISCHDIYRHTDHTHGTMLKSYTNATNGYNDTLDNWQRSGWGVGRHCTKGLFANYQRHRQMQLLTHTQKHTNACIPSIWESRLRYIGRQRIKKNNRSTNKQNHWSFALSLLHREVVWTNKQTKITYAWYVFHSLWTLAPWITTTDVGKDFCIPLHTRLLSAKTLAIYEW